MAMSAAMGGTLRSAVTTQVGSAPPTPGGPGRPAPPRVSSTADRPPERATRVEGSIATADPGPDRAAPRLPRGIGATVRAALASFDPRWLSVGFAVLGALVS